MAEPERKRKADEPELANGVGGNDLDPATRDKKRLEEARREEKAQERYRKWVRRGVVLLLAAVGVFTAIGSIDGGAAWPVVGILLLIGLLLALPVSNTSWRGIRQGVKSFSIGPVSAELFNAAQAAPSVDDDGRALEDRKFDVHGIQLKLESRLAYVAKHMLAPYDKPEGTQFATIGSLSYDGFLDPRDARVASEVMTLRPADLDGMDVAEQIAFLSGINKVVDNFRVSVLFGLTKKILATDDRAKVADIPDPIRPLLKVSIDERTAILVVVFTTNRASDSFKNSVRRLGTAAASENQTDDLFIVVPDVASSNFKSDPPNGTKILRVGDLAGEFGLSA